MTWSLVGAQTHSEAEGSRYKLLTFEVGDPAIAYGISIQTPADDSLPRLRVGFYYPFATVEDREYVGPSEEMFYGGVGRQRAIHFLRYDFLDQWPGIGSRVDRFGVAVAPDRGCYPATSLFWRLT